MLRQANENDWNDFFDVTSKFGLVTLRAILKTDPQLKDALSDIEKDREIQRLRAELADARSNGNSGKISDLLKRIANRLTDKQIEILNRAADKLQV
jgi:predicted DNA binding protein